MRVVFACAGTGGHINPAIAIAKIILNNDKDSKVLFIGTKDGLENKLVKNAGFNIEHISTGKLLREITLKNFKAIFDTCKGIFDSKRILKEFKPDLIIGTGGYICGPVMLAAQILKIPYLLHESNAFPGISVKMLSKRASKVMVSFDDAKKRLKYKENVVCTGTPAKFNVEEYDKLSREECLEELKLNNINKKIILVTCGSQGAKIVNETVLEMASKILSDEYFIVLVTGDRTYDEILQKKYNLEKENNINLDEYLRIEKFVFNMDKMYKAADMCIVRGGAMTITELSICKKPSIIIPLPTAAENHQYYNAKVLENEHAAVIINQKDLDYKMLNQKILDMLKDNNYLKMGENARRKLSENVEEKIYKCITETLKMGD